MKNIKKVFSVFTVLAAALANNATAQNTLQFTGISVSPEKAILLQWLSASNEVYEIDYTDDLGGTNGGIAVWSPLYTDYPSQGTNTFIADAGNYEVTPIIPHPSLSPARFYQIKLMEGDNSDTPPTVSITSPTNGNILSGDIMVSVTASANDIVGNLNLYIDGELQWQSDDGTNFPVNTCEWANGPHELLATAKSQSSCEGATDGAVIQYGRGVSSSVNVTFSNLISSINFSQPFFEPALGQTQEVTAIFATNADWTLQIQDVNSNSVRTVSGTGGSMLFDWEGTGDGGVSIPDGVYNYLFTAQVDTNASQIQGGNGGSGSGGPPSPSLGSMAPVAESTQLFAMPADGSGIAVPLVLYPPGYDTNSLIIFEGAWCQIMTPNSEVASASASSMISPLGAAPMYAGPSSQSTTAPKRKPRNGVKGEVGTFGICYMTYGTNASSSPHPQTGWPYPLPAYVAIDGQSRTAQTVDQPISNNKPLAAGFADQMQKKGWKAAFIKGEGAWGASDIKKASIGGNSIFNTCNFGLLCTHGSAGNSGSTGQEADGITYSYIYLGRNNWLHLSDMDFGSAGSNGLRWMTVTGCSLLNLVPLDSMEQNGKTFMNDNLHLLMGSATVSYSSDNLGTIYATNLLANLHIPDAWFQTGHICYHGNHTGITNSVIFRVLGNGNCQNDTLVVYNDPDPSQDGWESDDLVFDLSNP